MNVLVDITPGSDINPINVETRGVLPVSILDSGDYDVSEIDLSSILLEGEVKPVRARLQEGADGYVDLRMLFSITEVLNALRGPQPGKSYEVRISGTFKNGAYFRGIDTVLAIPRSSRKRASER